MSPSSGYVRLGRRSFGCGIVPALLPSQEAEPEPSSAHSFQVQPAQRERLSPRFVSPPHREPSPLLPPPHVPLPTAAAASAPKPEPLPEHAAGLRHRALPLGPGFCPRSIPPPLHLFLFLPRGELDEPPVLNHRLWLSLPLRLTRARAPTLALAFHNSPPPPAPTRPLPRHLAVRIRPRGRGAGQDVGQGDDEEARDEGGREEGRGHARPRVEVVEVGPWHDPFEGEEKIVIYKYICCGSGCDREVGGSQ